MEKSSLLSNQVCIVTGAGKGIGYDCAKVFAAHGASLALITRTGSDFEILKEDLNLSEDKILCTTGDVSKEAVVNHFVSKVVDKFGKIDVLVNNAGMRMRKPYLDITLEEWNHVMQVNAGSVFLFCQAVGRQMVKQKSGRIINIASIVGTLGLEELVGYGASKGAVISLTKSLALEWAPYNVNVNVIAPGFCETSYADAFKEKKDLYDFTLDRTPMRKWGKGKDVANACLYLASELSDYVTGEVLNVDGGWSAW